MSGFFVKLRPHIKAINTYKSLVFEPMTKF